MDFSPPISLGAYVLALELMLLIPAALLAAFAFHDRLAPHRREGQGAGASGTNGSHSDALHGCAG